MSRLSSFSAWVLTLFFVVSAGTVTAATVNEATEHGPRVPPCEGCPVSPGERPYPRAGMWYDPARNGSGINMEVQNGVVFGLFFGYGDDGKAVWYEFSGELVPVEDDSGAYWTMESDLRHWRGGNCIDCPYQPPENTGAHGRMAMTVEQRNLISYTIDGGEVFRMQPLVWGTPMARLFPEVSDHGQPMFPPDETVSPSAPGPGLVPWTLFIRKPDPFPDLYLTALGTFWVASDLLPDQYEFQMAFLQWHPGNPNPYLPVTLNCGSHVEEGVLENLSDSLRERLGPDAVCVARLQTGEDTFEYYVAPLGDVGDDHFIATAEDGRVLEGHRLLYR